MKTQKRRLCTGTTLIEVVISLAVSGIIFSALITILVYGNKILNSTRDNFNEHSQAIALETRIRSEVQYAKSITIYADPTSNVTESNSVYYGTSPYIVNAAPQKSGLVIRKSGNVQSFMQGQLSPYTCTITFARPSQNSALNVTVTISKNGGQTYTLVQSIPLSNIGTGVTGGTTAISGASSGTMIGFDLYLSPS